MLSKYTRQYEQAINNSEKQRPKELGRDSHHRILKSTPRGKTVNQKLRMKAINAFYVMVRESRLVLLHVVICSAGIVFKQVLKSNKNALNAGTSVLLKR